MSIQRIDKIRRVSLLPVTFGEPVGTIFVPVGSCLSARKKRFHNCGFAFAQG
jgi:hypothetical protein